MIIIALDSLVLGGDEKLPTVGKVRLLYVKLSQSATDFDGNLP